VWKKYWKFNDWVAEKILGEKVDSMEEWKEIPKRWRRLKKEPIRYIMTTGKEILQANIRHFYKFYRFLKKFIP
tara:strand:+ start:252 stop:470 length:219 start_codon:yes stop_codon:yes gene_type:complete